MRAITVRQPWAWAIIHGGKDVENRSRNIAGAYRGPVAIHAGLRIDSDYDRALIGQAVGRLAREGASAGLRSVAQHAGDPLTPGNAISERFGNLGAIIGVIDLVDVHHATDVEPVLCGICSAGCCGCSPWAMPDNWHLTFANPRPLAKPIPYKGQLGLWTLPDDVLAGAL